MSVTLLSNEEIIEKYTVHTSYYQEHTDIKIQNVLENNCSFPSIHVCARAQTHIHTHTTLEQSVKMIK